MSAITLAASPVKLLSIDGGGIRGLAALVMLEQLMFRVNFHRSREGNEPVEPWQLFDMIGGTSTGGLIAVMLGRLKMSITDTKKAYEDLAAKAFTPKNLLKNMFDKVTLGAKYETKPLEEAIQTIIGDDWSEKLLRDDDPDSHCKTFVVSHITNIDQPVTLRSYLNPIRPKRSLDVMRIWQACRATTAALTFFDAIEVDGVKYRDGGLKYNNPVQIVHAEAAEMFPGRDQLMISLGTGSGTPRNFEPSLMSVATMLANLATQTEDTANEFYRRDNCKEALAGRYFRFNIAGMGDVGMDEADQLKFITTLSESHLELPANGQEIDRCAQALSGALVATRTDQEERVVATQHGSTFGGQYTVNGGNLSQGNVMNL